MVPVHGISWDDRKRRSVSAIATAAALLVGAGALATVAAREHAPRLRDRACATGPGCSRGRGGRRILGGHVQEHIALINAVVADVPASAVADLEASPGVSPR